MKLKRLFSPALLALVVALLGLAASGCGDDDATAEQSSEAYAEMLSGLKEAALADGTFSAAQKAGDLPVAEREVIRAFCETAWQLVINSETARLNKDEYMVARIRNLAEYDLSSANTPGDNAHQPAITAAMDELRKTLDLAAIDPELNRRYKKACYLKPGQAGA